MLIDVQVLFGLGKSSIRVKTELIRMVCIVIGVLLCCYIFNANIQFLALSNAIAACIGTLSTHIEVKKLLSYSIIDRIKDTGKSIFAAIMMCVVLFISDYLFGSLNLPSIIYLAIKVVVGMIVYILSSFLLKNSVFFEIIKIIKSRINKNG